MNHADVVVMGGGLAGIAAAVRAAEAGRRVILLETSRRLGGRATSHDDPQSGRTVDNCQHVVMGCCTNLLDLYDRLGVRSDIHWASFLHFFDKQGHHDVLSPSMFAPAPFHLGQSMMRFGCLSMPEKLAIARAMLAMIRLGSGRERFAKVTFTQWLQQQHQPPGAIEKFWAVIIISALNCHPDRACAATAIHVFQDGFLRHRDAYLLGTAAVPLRFLYDPAVQRIESAGGRICFGTAVAGIHETAGRVSHVSSTDGQTFTAEHYISALPFDRLDKAADDSLKAADSRLQRLNRFEHSPILGIHLWLDRAAVSHGHMIFVDSPLQWIFRKHEERDGEQYLHGVISAADDWLGESNDAILAMAMRELAAYVPRVADAELLRGKVIREKRATYRPTPEVEADRPAATGAVANLLLAGDWVQTGWPATMEGAVRSGYAAAEAMNPAAGRLRIDDLPMGPIMRILSRR